MVHPYSKRLHMESFVANSHAAMEFINTLWTDKSEEEKRKVRDNLLKYCALDTKGMVEIVRKLHEIVK